MPTLRSQRTYPLTLKSTEQAPINAGITAAYDYQGDPNNAYSKGDGVPHVGSVTFGKSVAGTVPLVQVTPEIAGRDLSVGLTENRYYTGTNIGNLGFGSADGLGDFTIHRRFRAPAAYSGSGVSRIAAQYGDANGSRIALYFQDSTNGYVGMSWEIHNGGAAWVQAPSNSNRLGSTANRVPYGAIFDVVVTRTGSTIKAFLNGSLVGTVEAPNLRTYSTNWTGSAMKNGLNTTPPTDLIFIDEVIWNRALSDDEVAAYSADPYSGYANTIVAPTGTITNQPPPDGQSQRFVGTTTAATNGTYTLTGSNGGVTVGPASFDITNNTFDFTVTGLAPGTYTPSLTVTGEGGKVGVSGTSTFSIAGVSGGGDVPPVNNDTTAPTITAATVASNAPGVVVLTSSEPLDTNSVPAASAFTVTGHTVQSVAIQGSAINLTVTPVFANGETPRTASYVVPGTNPVRDVATPTPNALAAFSGLAITNNVAAPVSTITGVTINPTAATLAGGATQAFTATAQGTNNPAQSFTWTRNPAVGTISGNNTANGSFVAPAATNAPQVIEITATSTQDPNYSAKATVTVPAAAPAGTNFTRSLSRTIKVKPAPQMFEGGPFWNMTNKTRPVGTIDKDETIDVSFDLTEVLADISDTVKKIDFDLAGLTSAGGYFTGAVATVFVSNAVPLAGGKNPTITCRMTTNSTPSRVEDWTVELKIEDQ